MHKKPTKKKAMLTTWEHVDKEQESEEDQEEKNRSSQPMLQGKHYFNGEDTKEQPS